MMPPVIVISGGESNIMDNAGDDKSSAAFAGSLSLDSASFEKRPPPGALDLVLFTTSCAGCASALAAEETPESVLPPVRGTSTIVDSSGDGSSRPTASLVSERLLGGEEVSGTGSGCASAVRAASGEIDDTSSRSLAVFDRLLRLLLVFERTCCRAAVRLVAAAPSTSITDLLRPLPGASRGLSPISSSAGWSEAPEMRRAAAAAADNGVARVEPSAVTPASPPPPPMLKDVLLSSLSRLLFADEFGVARTGAGACGEVAARNAGVGAVAVVSCGGDDSTGASRVSGRDRNRSKEASCTWCRCAPRIRCCMRSSRPKKTLAGRRVECKNNRFLGKHTGCHFFFGSVLVHQPSRACVGCRLGWCEMPTKM